MESTLYLFSEYNKLTDKKAIELGKVNWEFLYVLRIGKASRKFALGKIAQKQLKLWSNPLSKSCPSLHAIKWYHHGGYSFS